MERKLTPVKRQPCNPTNEMASPRTPLSFSRELRQAIQERNQFTAKTRNKVCSMLERSPVNNPDMDKRQMLRNQAVQEIITSEQKYLQQLEMLMAYFVGPLKALSIIDERDHTRLFGQLEMIYNLNGELLRELCGNLDNVAQAFVRMAPFFKLYSVYAFDYRNSLLIVQSLTSKNPVFRRFIQEAESRPEVQRKLNSLMIVPIQRVPRYKLLLQQVLLYTSPADQDYKLLRESIKQIESSTSHINSCIADQEVTLMLINLQNSLVGRTPHIVKPSRKVIREGVLMKVTRTGTELKRYCVLMSDLFMYCKVLKERPPNTVVDNSLECCCIFPLKKCKVYELFPGNFKLTCQGDGIILGSRDLHDCNVWVHRIRDAIELHIQCRQTLRKESSKRTPIRKKDMSKFDTDSSSNSPTKKKSDYDKVFRNLQRSSDSDDELSSPGPMSCFSRKRPLRVDPDTPRDPSSGKRSSARTNPIASLYKHIAGPKSTSAATPGTAANNNNKSNSYDPDQPYAFAGRYSDTKSYFRTNNVDTMPSSAQRDCLFSGDLPADTATNFRDVLFPLRSSGGSNKSSSAAWTVPQASDPALSPPHKKRVKFNEPNDENSMAAAEPYRFPPDVVAPTQESLRDRIYRFFAKLF